MDLTNQLILADLLLLIYLVKVKTTRQIFSNYVCFSKSPNFKSLGLLYFSTIIFLDLFKKVFLFYQTDTFV